MLISRTAFAALLLAGSLAALTACGKTAPGATNFDPATGKHTPADWTSNHGTTFVQYQKQCKQCHGGDLKGGTSGISCSSAARNGLGCHANGPHPVPFIHYSGHLLVNPKLANDTNLCAPCHGIAFQGGRLAPACGKCHTGLVITADNSSPVPIRGACNSCHGKTAGPDGGIFPNRSGAHPQHFARVNGNLSCRECHLGGGSGTTNHGRTLTLTFPATINVPGATAAYDATLKTCSNVSCHGGKTTPGWGIGRIATDSNCTACHVSGKGNASAPYNSYSSGQHNIHVAFGCTVCHDTRLLFSGSLPNHFSNLTSHRLEQSPRFTMFTSMQYSSTVQTCATKLCHGKAGHSWR